MVFSLSTPLTKLRVLVLCFPYFTDNSINSVEIHPQLSNNNSRWWASGCWFNVALWNKNRMKKVSCQQTIHPSWCPGGCWFTLALHVWRSVVYSVHPLFCHDYGTRCPCTPSQMMTHVNWKSCFMVGGKGIPLGIPLSCCPGSSVHLHCAFSSWTHYFLLAYLSLYPK
jgi:hypothetical protein